MIRRHPNRLAAFVLASGLLGLILAPASTFAQDGQRRTESPVTTPETDELLPREDPISRPKTTADLLPPVPASANDPAPPGTLAVPPEAINNPQGRALTPAQAAMRARQLQGINRVEGVVIAIEQPEGAEGDTAKLPNEKVRLIIDPSQTWEDFAFSGPLNIDENQDGPSATAPPIEGAEPTNPPAGAAVPAGEPAPAAAPPVNAADREPNDANTRVGAEPNAAPVAEDPAAARPGAVDVAVTARTHVFVHARTKDGIDLLNMATASSPNLRAGRVGVTGTVVREPAARPIETNFTNIHVGSFVSVRYRPVNGTNQAVNVSLIELPLLSPDEAAQLPGGEPIPAARPGVSGIPTDASAVPVRVPAIPGREASPGGAIPR